MIDYSYGGIDNNTVNSTRHVLILPLYPDRINGVGGCAKLRGRIDEA